MWRLVAAGFSLVTACLIYFLLRLYQMRKAMDGLPSSPRLPGLKGWLVGNINIAAECQQHFPSDVHPQVFVQYISQKYNLRNFFYQDWWPLGPRWLFITDPVIVSQYVTTTQSLPKSSLETTFLNIFLGKRNMVGLEGNEWKSLRSMFNPGFAAQHLVTLTGYIVDASSVFCDVLHKDAQRGGLMELEDKAANLTIDIIAKVVSNSDLDAQRRPHPIVTTFRARASLMPPPNDINPLKNVDLFRPWKLWWNGRQLDRLLGVELDRNMAARAREARELQEKPAKKTRQRSVVDLAIDGYTKELEDAGQKIDLTAMPARIRSEIIDSMKTFIFAGHDTTSSTIAYAMYLLHLNPDKAEKLMDELDEVFGKDLSQVADQIKSNPYIINKLEYTTAVIKEVLRLYPPASTMRYHPMSSDASKNLYFVDPKTETRYPLSGFEVWPVVHAVGRNEDFFPEPISFIPERFIPELTPFPDARLFTPAGKDAWRAFEKGPRACIGQELAMMEMRIILAMVVRTFDFVCELDGIKVEQIQTVPSVDEYKNENGTWKQWGKRQTIEGQPLYQILKGAAKPRGGVPGRMLLRNRS